MEILSFLSNMDDVFDGQRLIEALVSRSVRFFVTGSAQNDYTNVGYPDTHNDDHLAVTWFLFIHPINIRLITDDIPHKEHYAVILERRKRNETEIYFAKRIEDIAHRYWNVFSNAELVNCFNQGLPTPRASLSGTGSVNFPVLLFTTWNASKTPLDCQNCSTFVQGAFCLGFDHIDPRVSI